MTKEKRNKLRLYIARVGRTKFKVLVANPESADKIAGRTLGGIWEQENKRNLENGLKTFIFSFFV